jgi:hypothetical protein
MMPREANMLAYIMVSDTLNVRYDHKHFNVSASRDFVIAAAHKILVAS